MKKKVGFTEAILTANPKNKLNLGTLQTDANKIPNDKFEQIDKLISDKIRKKATLEANASLK